MSLPQIPTTATNHGNLSRSSWLLMLLTLSCGCGTTISRTATEQLLTSDAVDRAVAQIDFHVLSGKTVFFDTRFIKSVKGVGFVNADYIISSLRQQMVASNCLLQDNQDAAEYIVEARIGVLGSDNHEVNYGIPASNMVTSASALVPTMPMIPPIPELSFAKRNVQYGTAKIGIFAYDQKTRRPIWQSGISKSKSTANDTWLFGMGPFQRGTIRQGTGFAGSRIALPFFGQRNDRKPKAQIAYDQEFRFSMLEPTLQSDQNSSESNKNATEGSQADQNSSESNKNATEDSQADQNPSESNKSATEDSTEQRQVPAKQESIVEETPDAIHNQNENLTAPIYLFPDEMKIFSMKAEFLPGDAATENTPEENANTP